MILYKYMVKKICLVTGTRAEYGLSYSILRAIEAHPRLSLQLIVTGMHLLPEYGHTIDFIKKDGFSIAAEIPLYGEHDFSGAGMANAIAVCIEKLTIQFKKNRPDIIIAMTDLGFTLASAIVGAHMNIPVAHVHGGDVSGSVDDAVRHATTQLSSIHFPASQKSAEKITTLLGGDVRHLYTVGAPGLDILYQQTLLDEKKIREKYHVSHGPYVLFIQHPVTTEVEEASEQYIITLSALKKVDVPVILIYPNADAGSSDIIDIIEDQYDDQNISIYKSIPRKEFLSLLKYAGTLVGNSSCGIVEAPSLFTPVVNIGNRQKNRECVDTVLHVGHDVDDITQAIRMALYDKDFQYRVKHAIHPYGDGTAGKKIAEILDNLNL